MVDEARVKLGGYESDAGEYSELEVSREELGSEEVVYRIGGRSIELTKAEQSSSGRLWGWGITVRGGNTEGYATTSRRALVRAYSMVYEADIGRYWRLRGEARVSRREASLGGCLGRYRWVYGGIEVGQWRLAYRGLLLMLYRNEFGYRLHLKKWPEGTTFRGSMWRWPQSSLEVWEGETLEEVEGKFLGRMGELSSVGNLARDAMKGSGGRAKPWWSHLKDYSLESGGPSTETGNLLAKR